MVKGPASAGPSERSERFEPFVRPRRDLAPDEKRDGSVLLELWLGATRVGCQAEELEDGGRRVPLWQVKM